jgi:hypothetical protein
MLPMVLFLSLFKPMDLYDCYCNKVFINDHPFKRPSADYIALGSAKAGEVFQKLAIHLA